QTRYLVEKPAAAGVHQLGVALELGQAQRPHLLLVGEVAPAVVGQEARLRPGGAVHQHLDVAVAGRPRVVEQLAGLLLAQLGRPVAQPVEGVAERAAPVLAPAEPPRVAAAVRPPALDAVDAAPGGALLDLDLQAWREALEELAVVGEPGRA